MMMSSREIYLIFVTLAFISCASALRASNRLIKKIDRTSLSRQMTTGSSDFINKLNWDFIDEVYLITTNKSGNERLERTKAELKKVNLLDKVQIRTFKTDDEDRVRGCYTSHMSVLEEIQRKTKKSSNSHTSLILEDNLEVTAGMSEQILSSIQNFLATEKTWDVFQLAYMMYVPGLKLDRLRPRNNEPWRANIVQMFAESTSSVGTSAYLISKSGVDKMLAKHKSQGYVDAVPVIMAELYPKTRFASFPMIFHRAGAVNSLVNPQLDSFRKVMFTPALYRNWERLMVYTGLQNNQLFPALVVLLMSSTLYALYQLITTVILGSPNKAEVPAEISLLSSSAELIALFPLFVALWGASLFKPGNTGAGFATSSQQGSKK